MGPLGQAPTPGSGRPRQKSGTGCQCKGIDNITLLKIQWLVNDPIPFIRKTIRVVNLSSWPSWKGLVCHRSLGYATKL